MVYDFVEDNNGFLWITTDNGVSRFDGRHFYNYSIKDGLLSNDVLQVIKQQDGTIWVNCFKRPPSYFDQNRNQFITVTNKTIENISKNFLKYIMPGKESILFYANCNFFEIRNKKYVGVYQHSFVTVEGKRMNIVELNTVNNFENKITEKDGRIYLQTKFDQPNKKIVAEIYLINNALFTKGKTNIQKYYDFTKSPSFQFKEQEINIPEGIKWHRFNNDRLYIITCSGAMRIYNTNNLELQKELFLDKTINSFFEDSHKNIWCGTLNNGVKCYLYSPIKKLEIPKKLIETNFLSIALSKKGKLFAGNLHGEVLTIENNNFQKYTIKDTTAFIRNIVLFNEKPLTISEPGYSFDQSSVNRLINKNNTLACLKRATKVNDSIALLSVIDGIIKLNVHTQSYKALRFLNERVLSISKMDSDQFLIIAASGFYHYDLKKEQYKCLLKKYDFLEGVSDGNLFFVSTTLGEIYIFKNEKLFKIIPNSAGLPENLIRIKVINHKLWISSRNEVDVINYKVEANKLLFNIQKITKNDGFISNSTNDICYLEPNVYLATDCGISVIPENIKIPKFDIQPQLVSIKINQKKQPISNYYELKKNEKDISLLLSGVELSGHFKNFQYALNIPKSWNNIESNRLDLFLESGKTIVFIRAIDNNNNIGSKVLKLKFNVAIPFYENLFFWIFIMVVVVAFVFRTFNLRKFEKQQREFEKQLALEQQRNKITSDLHDDIGATLSSLQINSAVAGKLLKKNPEEAQKVLEKIENQSQNLAEKIGDIIWSMKPGKDEFMTMSTRIKNFVNEILGDTDILYSIQIEPIVDIVVKDIVIRKNIILLTKEAVNNAAKYSKANHLEINLSILNDIIYLKISDDGIGFNAAEITGNGVTNMKRRAEVLSGSFSINSESKKGTTIIVTIPVVP